jgi:hypothetical protein
VVWEVPAGRDVAAAMHPHHPRAARRAQRAGLQVAVVPRPLLLDGFREVYEATMRRQQAESFFFFGRAYWHALLASGDALGLVLVEGRLRGELVAALLCLSAGPWLHYHLGASADAGRAVGASTACFVAAAEWAQSVGMARFHLGGGVGGDSASPLFVFKHRFDPAAPPLPFHVAKLVHDRDRYVRLTGSGSTAGFFPPWRRTR